MAFVPKDWRDAPDTSTPITAAALEDMETRLAAYADQTASPVRVVATALRPSPMPVVPTLWIPVDDDGVPLPPETWQLSS